MSEHTLTPRAKRVLAAVRGGAWITMPITSDYADCQLGYFSDEVGWILRSFGSPDTIEFVDIDWGEFEELAEYLTDEQIEHLEEWAGL